MKILKGMSTKGGSASGGKILLFTLEYPPFKGGVANVYGNIVKYWIKKDEIIVLNNNENKLINNNLPFLKWLPAIWQLWRVVQPKKSPSPPFIKGVNKVNHILVGHILPLGTATYIISKFTRIKYSVILHGMDLTFSQKVGRKKKLAKKILKNSENIICMNSYVAEKAAQIINKKMRDKIKIVNPGIDNKFLTAEYEPRGDLIKKYNLQDKIILFSVGRLVKRKGFDKVIESLPRALDEVSNLTYVLAGAGPDEEYLKNITAENLIPQPPFSKEGEEKKVIFLGKITDEEKWAWLNLCDIFIMPSRNIDGDFEGFGIVYLEANLAGKPVIAGDSGGIKDAVENNFNGLIVNPEDKDEISRSIIKLSKDKELRKKLGEQGRERAINEFNWERQVDKIYQIISPLDKGGAGD